MENNDYLLRRVQEYKTDFACYAYSCFNAFNRLSNLEQRKIKHIKLMNIFSLSLSVFSISAFMTQFLESIPKEISLLLATILGFISIILNLFSILSKEESQSKKYFIRAERVNVLWKEVRNIEALIYSGKISAEEVIDNLNYFQKETEKHATDPLYISPEDYDKARKQLKDGQKSYNEKELNN
ncbi:hypothetical protein HR13_07065 [Porphyromonas gulae]|uniref:hypothetical protein n=1 Tax=Porphyromonas gulae TaxID=111105 RepID=UPI000377E794|nr:hypothetical protein [Porphyromonas gulae]KGN79496.1 hypothetical protein HR13_07065 [Porphyromonas gulae]